MVLNGTSLSCNNALLALNWRYADLVSFRNQMITKDFSSKSRKILVIFGNNFSKHLHAHHNHSPYRIHKSFKPKSLPKRSIANKIVKWYYHGLFFILKQQIWWPHSPIIKYTLLRFEISKLKKKKKKKIKISQTRMWTLNYHNGQYQKLHEDACITYFIGKSCPREIKKSFVILLLLLLLLCPKKLSSICWVMTAVGLKLHELFMQIVT